MADRVDHLARLIQREKDAHGWSVRDIADQSGGLVGRSAVNNYLHGQGAMPPSEAIMHGLAAGLHIAYQEVLAAVFATLGGGAQNEDRLARFDFLTSDDVDELIELARLRNDRRRKQRRRRSG